jgi:hypothetical protein
MVYFLVVGYPMEKTTQMAMDAVINNGLIAVMNNKSLSYQTPWNTKNPVSLKQWPFEDHSYLVPSSSN